MLEAEIKQQLSQYLELLESDVVIKISAGSNEEMRALVDELTLISNRIVVEPAELQRAPSFQIGERITFAGVPLGHEFTSLVMALLQVSGRKPKVDDSVIEQIKSIDRKLTFETFVSLSCHNCPDVVQALNIMSVINPNITHTMIDGAAFQEEVETKNIMAVPAVFCNGEFFASGRMTLEEILQKLGQNQDINALDGKEYDVTIVGGGPAGAAAAIYSARKGLRTAIIAERFGGQVLDTLGIENLIGTPYTEGPRLVASLEEHVREYEVEIHTLHRVNGIKREGKDVIITTESGATVKSKTAIVATGARWRNLNVPGEERFKNKGVAYCPHCDGPLFKGKDVAVVGGGNSGVEAAIDLAGIVNHVTVLEYGSALKADSILQKKLNSLSNVTVITDAQTTEITGTTTVNGITYIDRKTNETKNIELDGVFVQIGLIPNTEWLDVEKTSYGEIKIDFDGATSMSGVFAAGDCTSVPYKQIIISMGAGATAALGVLDYLIRIYN